MELACTVMMWALALFVFAAALALLVFVVRD
jgi:hypothetical protein